MKSLIAFVSAAAHVLIVGAPIAFAAAAGEDVYPNKPIRVIVPYAAGGSTDTYARLISQKLNEIWGQQVIVENRPGGFDVIAATALLKAPADGYTIMAMTQNHVIVPHLISTPYDALKDFAPVATMSLSQQVLVVHPSVPAHNLPEFIALARSKPGQLNYATAGTGTISHLTTEIFNTMTGVKMQPIPYKSSAHGVNDVIGGQVQLYFVTPISAVPHVKTGRLRALAISGETRLPALPQVPTFSESGLPGFDVGSWSGVLARAATPRPVIDKLSGEIAKVLAMPDVREKLLNQGSDAFISTPEQFAALLKTDLAKYGRVIKALNIKFEN